MSLNNSETSANAATQTFDCSQRGCDTAIQPLLVKQTEKRNAYTVTMQQLGHYDARAEWYEMRVADGEVTNALAQHRICARKRVKFAVKEEG
jgi:hypothetical protein